MKKLSVCVLFGGVSSEHEVSLRSAESVLNRLDKDKYHIFPVGITKDGDWILFGGKDYGMLPAGTWQNCEENRRAALSPVRGQGLLSFENDCVVRERIDVVFPVMHGENCEDGAIQGLLQIAGIPYVGPRVAASAACMDKHYTKVVLDAAGIPTAPGVTVDARNFTAADVLAEIEDAGLTYPLFVKPSRAGSSFGVTKVEKADDRETQQDRLAAAIATAGEHDWKVLVEQGIDGREIECAVLCPKAGDEPEASWPGEIVLDHQNDDQFYDFDSKYMDASASHVEVPANLPVSVLEDVRDVARRAFKAVDGAGVGRGGHPPVEPCGHLRDA